MTPKEINLREINHLIEIFNEQFNQACENPGSIPLIEMDLMKQTVRNLYTQLDQLGKLRENSTPLINSIPAAEEKVAITDPVIIEKQYNNVVQEMIFEKPEEVIVSESVVSENNSFEIIAEEKIMHSQEENSVTETIQVKEIYHTPEIEKTISITEATKISKPELKKGMVAGLFDETPSVASKFNSTESIYDKISKTKQDPSLADTLTKKPVEDLKKSIGINARFAFINELFSGDQHLFHESIDRINKSSAFEEARKVLYEDLADKMKWNTSAKPFSDLEELVKRRFGV